MRPNQQFVNMLKFVPAVPPFPAASFHIDASLPTSAVTQYGFNKIQGGFITELCNLSDVLGGTNPSGSASKATVFGIDTIYVRIPATPLFTRGRAFTSTLTYNSSSTYSTYFCVTTTSHDPNQESYVSIIRSLGASAANGITHDTTGGIFQANKTISDTSGMFQGTQLAGSASLVILRGSTTETSNGTLITNKGLTWSRNGAILLGSDFTQTTVLDYWITNSTSTAGLTMSFNEIIYFDHLLSDPDISTVETYLKNKWNIIY